MLSGEAQSQDTPTEIDQRDKNFSFDQSKHSVVRASLTNITTDRRTSSAVVGGREKISPRSPKKTYTCLLTHMRLDSETKLPMKDLLLLQQQGDELPQRRGRKDCEHHAAATTAGIRDAAKS